MSLESRMTRSDDVHVIDGVSSAGRVGYCTVDAACRTQTNNEDSLIFADNWGMSTEVTSDNPYNDNYSAGFSTIDKWAIYTWVRDLVYI